MVLKMNSVICERMFDHIQSFAKSLTFHLSDRLRRKGCATSSDPRTERDVVIIGYVIRDNVAKEGQ